MLSSMEHEIPLFSDAEGTRQMDCCLVSVCSMLGRCLSAALCISFSPIVMQSSTDGFVYLGKLKSSFLMSKCYAAE